MTLTPAQHESAFQAFERAVGVAGGNSAFSRVVGCTPANVYQMRKARRLLSPQFVIRAEAATGVSRRELRPDLYPPEERAPDVPSAPHSAALHSPGPHPVAQHPAAHPSASASPPPRPEADADGSLPALDYPGKPAPAQAGDPLEGMAA